MNKELKHESKEIRNLLFLFSICAELVVVIIYIITH